MKKFIAVLLFVVMMVVFVPFSTTLAEDNNEDTFTIVWLSDTQNMSEYSYNHAMQRMGQWISDQKEVLNIQYVVQTGDAVENGANPKYWAEFDLMLDKFKDEIPYIGAAGNHEIKKNGYLEYLARPEILSIPKENSYKNGEASYSTFEVDGCKFIIVAVGYGIEEESIGWVNFILENHKDHSAILLYHDYMQTSGRFSKNGKLMFKQIVLSNPNVRLVLCGHVLGLSSRIDSIDDNGDGIPDRTVTQMMYNYDLDKDHGQLRTLQFNTTNHSITVTTYSPITERYYRDWMNGDQYTFVLKDAF